MNPPPAGPASPLPAYQARSALSNAIMFLCIALVVMGVELAYISVYEFSEEDILRERETEHANESEARAFNVGAPIDRPFNTKPHRPEEFAMPFFMACIFGSMLGLFYDRLLQLFVVRFHLRFTPLLPFMIAAPLWCVAFAPTLYLTVNEIYFPERWVFFFGPLLCTFFTGLVHFYFVQSAVETKRRMMPTPPPPPSTGNTPSGKTTFVPPPPPFSPRR